MNIRRVAVIGSAVAVVVTVLFAWLSAPEAAITSLGAAVLGVLAVLVLQGRALSSGLEAARRESRSSRRQLAKVSQQLERVGRRMDKSTARAQGSIGTGEVDKELRKEFLTIFAEVQKTPGLTVELSRVYDRLVDHQQPMPPLGGWALSPSTLLWLLDHLATTQTRTVLECGSGSSTVWIATALERLGREGTVTSLESSDQYAEVTRAELERLGLSHRATVVHAPLVETELPGRPPQRWFDLSALPDGDPVDLLIVDGPVRMTAPLARYPAYPLLAERLAPGATVLLDDTHRPTEAEIVEVWAAESHHGRRLAPVRTIDRSTIFATTRV